MRPVPSARRLLLAATAVAALLLIPTTADAAVCRGADTPVSAATVKQARHAVLCLHNRIRRAHHLRAFRASRSLTRAATRHSRQMVRESYFDHTSPGGSTLLTRARSAGYLRSAFSFSLGENIGWGEGTLSTPRAMVRAWMRSPGHRANILTPRFRDIGAGIVAETPGHVAGGTFTTDFGRRR